MSAEKKSLRKEYIRRRDGISSSLAMIYANAIRARLWNVAEFTEAHAVSGYHSTGSEVYTGDILRDVLARGTRLCLPRTGHTNDTINFALKYPKSQIWILCTLQWHILPEPT